MFVQPPAPESALFKPITTQVRLNMDLQSSTAILIPNRDESKHFWVVMPLEEAMEELRWVPEIVRKVLDRVPVESMRKHVGKATYTKLQTATR